MYIKEQKTKFTIGDVVYLIYNNKIEQGIVYGVNYYQSIESDLSNDTISKRIFNKFYKLFVPDKQIVRINYCVQRVFKDGSYGGQGIFGARTDNDIFHSKEELLKSL